MRDAFIELLGAAKGMRESLPNYSESSSAYLRRERLDAAITAAEDEIRQGKGVHRLVDKVLAYAAGGLILVWFWLHMVNLLLVRELWHLQH